jgi:ABC-type transport system involved in cytochrome c biogenesis permease subunit
VDIEWSLLAPLLGVMVLAILVTGPGLWSESWGWWWVKRARRRDGAGPSARRTR